MSIGTPTGFINFTNGTPRADKIVATSNIGIGTDAPACALDVVGTIHANSFVINNVDVKTTMGLDEVLNVSNTTTNTINITNTSNTALNVTGGAKISKLEAGSMRISDGFNNICDFSISSATRNWIQQSKLTASDAANSDNFGHSVSVSSDGNTAIMGAYADGDEAGSVYIFTRSGITWTQQAKLTASDAVVGVQFGYSVALSSDGNTAVVGARYVDDQYEGTDIGSVYIFTRTDGTWDTGTKIRATFPTVSSYFGHSVSISDDGNTIVVGANQDDDVGINTGAAYIFIRSGSTWTQQTKLTAFDGVTGDEFGYSVSISSDGNTVIVGAHRDSDGGADSGSVYIFSRSGSDWTQQAKLTASEDAAANDHFGYSVSISSDGNTAIVGSYGDDDGGTDSGSAYIFTRSGTSWSRYQKIRASDVVATDRFGWSVSISGDGNTAIVGAWTDDDEAGDSGSAYIFVRSGPSWIQKQKIKASDPGSSDRFGWSVSISGDGTTTVVGAYGDDDGGTDSGSAYIFVSNGTLHISSDIVANEIVVEDVKVSNLEVETMHITDGTSNACEVNLGYKQTRHSQKLTASDAANNDYFGESVSISSDGNTAIAGAWADDDRTGDSGSAYIFVRSDSDSPWTQQQKLTAGTDAGSSDHFGWSVSISGDGNTVIVGARYDDDNGQTNSGSAYIFVRSGSSWTQQQKLTAGTDAGNSDYFGYSVSISGDGNTVIVGAYFDDDNGQGNSGSAYIFVRSDGTWTQQQKLTAGTDAGSSDYFGWSVSISGDGNTVIVGAQRDDDNGRSDSGSAYIFVRSDGTWTQQQKLTASDPYGSDYFGTSVSISSDGNTVIVGAYFDDDNGQGNSGSAYIFVRSDGTWTQQQKLTAGTDAGSSDYFGWSVSISGGGNTVIVGAYYDDDNAQGDSGSAYIFVRSDGTWTQQQKLTASDPRSSDHFGVSVSISGDGNTTIVGARYADHYPYTSNPGSAYTFTTNDISAVLVSKPIYGKGIVLNVSQFIDQASRSTSSNSPQYGYTTPWVPMNANSKVKLDVHIPYRNDTSWGGSFHLIYMMVDKQVGTVAANTWVLLSSSGAYVNYYQEMISYENNFYIPLSVTTDYNIKFMHRYRVYSGGTLYINYNKEENTYYDRNVYQFGIDTPHAGYSKFIVTEIGG
jgi:hypothetical protein